MGNSDIEFVVVNSIHSIHGKSDEVDISLRRKLRQSRVQTNDQLEIAFSRVPIQLDVECLTCVVSFCNFVVSNLCFSLTPMSKGSSSTVMLGVVFGQAKGGGCERGIGVGVCGGNRNFYVMAEIFTNA